jgi:hypothetical protein
MSDATSLHSVVQQFSAMLGISLAAALLALSMNARGANSASLIDFSVGFLSMAMFVMISAVLSLRFSRDAGSELSGARRR